MSVTIEMKANAIRFLSMDAVQKANSGHPGAPMGMAEIATVLWTKFLQHNPQNPHFYNRDRFVLSNGHASMLLYSLLHLTGYEVSISDLQQFRQLHSKTAGHPEYREIPGVETTTGPLGQGLANAVGMALAEKMLAAQFNRPQHSIIDHYTYAFVGDGCLMEGISHEVSSLAGSWNLGKLIVLYDDNGISIDGQVHSWFIDDTAARFEAYGWQVIRHVNGHDADEIEQALINAKSEKERPTLIMCRTQIGYGSPNKAGSEATHGAPLGAAEIEATRAALHWPHAPFHIPDDIYAAFDHKTVGQKIEQDWQQAFQAYTTAYPELSSALLRRLKGDLPAEFAQYVASALSECTEKKENIATRVASQRALNALGVHLPELVGGSADLTPSNNTFFNASQEFNATTGEGNYLRFGVREFGMAALMNGVALHGGFKPYCATFLVFSDYARNAIRMSALMKVPAIYVMTHDSIGLGEDGPTHQPVEHIQSLRLIPNLSVWRPADTTETMVAWALALQSTHTPHLLALSRQNLPYLEKTEAQIQAIAQGGYVVHEVKDARLTLIATGSEVALAMELAKQYAGIRVVSMPCMEVFRAQPQDYKQQVLGNIKKVAIEAGVMSGWYEWADEVIGMNSFGASAPAADLFKHFGFTSSSIASRLGLDQ